MAKRTNYFEILYTPKRGFDDERTLVEKLHIISDLREDDEKNNPKSFQKWCTNSVGPGRIEIQYEGTSDDKENEERIFQIEPLFEKASFIGYVTCARQIKGWDIFISYASEDKDVVKETISLLLSNNYTVFHAPVRMKCGEDFRNFIQYGLSHSGMVLVLWTRNAERSAWVNQEIGYAIRHGITLKRKLLIFREKDVELTGFISNLNAHDLGEDRKSWPSTLLLGANTRFGEELFSIKCPNCGGRIDTSLLEELTFIREYLGHYFVNCLDCNKKYEINPFEIHPDKWLGREIIQIEPEKKESEEKEKDDKKNN